MVGFSKDFSSVSDFYFGSTFTPGVDARDWVLFARSSWSKFSTFRLWRPYLKSMSSEIYLLLILGMNWVNLEVSVCFGCALRRGG